jgi:6-phosphogluconolactonase
METTAKYKPNLEIVSDGETLAHRSVELFTTDAEKAIKAKGVFYVAISGGHTPKRFFELLSETPKSKALERYVPPDSQWSNYKLAADTFLPKVSIPKKNIHRIPTEYSDVKTAANRYEETIRMTFNLQENRIPEFDLILLGMGVEGHTGSLFPNSYASFDTEDLACVVYDLDRKLNRITLTHPVLCAASHLAVLVSGEEKANILKEVFTHEPDEVLYPIHALWPILSKVTWLVDSQAAKLL